MSEITYTLDLFSRISFSYKYEREDKIADVFSLMAYEQAALGNMDNYKKIILHPRFSDYCVKQLFGRFFSVYHYNTIPNPEINKEDLESNIDKAFRELLNANKLNFGILYKDHRSEFYFLIDPENEKIRSLNRIEMLLDYVLNNKIFISALGSDIGQLLDIEEITINDDFKDKIERYLSSSENDEDINNFIYYYSNGYVDLDSELEKDIPFEDNTLRKLFKIMLVIGFYFDKNKVIGEKDTSYKEENTCYVESQPYFNGNNIPDIFNNAYTHFEECLTVLAKEMDIDLSDENKSLMLSTYYKIHKNYYKYN